MPDGKRVTIAVKVSESDAARIDAQRGDLSRSRWMQEAIRGRLGCLPVVTVSPGVAVLAGRQAPFADPVISAVPESLARITPAPCPHPKARILKGLCNACGTNVGG
jgi:hypothetical protein